MSKFKPGDVVRVADYYDLRLVGHVFTVLDFSTLYHCWDHPVISNPYYEEDGQSNPARWPCLYIRFSPDQLEHWTVLDRLAKV